MYIDGMAKIGDTISWCGSLLILFAATGVGCGRGSDTQDEAATGTLALSMSDASGEVAGFQFDVSESDGHVVASRFVSRTGTGAATQTAEFFPLVAGAYQVTGTPMRSAGVPHPSCVPASAPATVQKGKSTELMLVARCTGTGKGGLAVTAGTNTAPEITSIAFDPSSQVSPCQPTTITVGANDVDADVLTYRFSATGEESTSTSGAPHTLEANGNRLRFTAAHAGELTIGIQVCDSLGCVDLSLPVHVRGSGTACVLACNDDNPCTYDAQSADGSCSHALVADGARCTAGNLHVKVLGINDFHGQLDPRVVSNRPAGGAAVLASYLEAAQIGIEDQTILVHAGDHVGASPPDSALFQDEPAIQFLNLLANDACSYTNKFDPACNVVGTFGNHEFDEGKGEILRLLGGGNFASGPFFESPYRGARFPYVSANVNDELTGQPIIAPYVIKTVRGVPVAFIGAVLKGTPNIVTPTGVAGLTFLDEATAINSYVPELKALGVHAIVVTIHQGGFQSSYTGPTRAAATLTSGPEILDIVSRLDDEIDVVVSGHSHAFTNALIPNAHGKPILVTQAFSASTAYDDIDLLIDPTTRDVVSKSASIVTTFGDAGPGLSPDSQVAALVSAADTTVAPLVNRVVGNTTVALSRNQTAAGESSLGDLIAEAQRAAMGTQLAFMNPGGIRADLDAGDITWGEVFIIQPFGNSLVRMNLTGAQIYAVLEQQWLGQTSPKIMQIAGFEYTWDPTLPVGSRVLQVRVNGSAIDKAATYSLTCNNFMAAGGDGYTTFAQGTDRIGGPIDLDALIDYVEARSPLSTSTDGRIQTP